MIESADASFVGDLVCTGSGSFAGTSDPTLIGLGWTVALEFPTPASLWLGFGPTVGLLQRGGQGLRGTIGPELELAGYTRDFRIGVRAAIEHAESFDGPFTHNQFAVGPRLQIGDTVRLGADLVILREEDDQLLGVQGSVGVTGRPGRYVALGTGVLGGLLAIALAAM